MDEPSPAALEAKIDVKSGVRGQARAQDDVEQLQNRLDAKERQIDVLSRDMLEFKRQIVEMQPAAEHYEKLGIPMAAPEIRKILLSAARAILR